MSYEECGFLVTRRRIHASLNPFEFANILNMLWIWGNRHRAIVFLIAVKDWKQSLYIAHTHPVRFVALPYDQQLALGSPPRAPRHNARAQASVLTMAGGCIPLAASLARAHTSSRIRHRHQISPPE